MSYQDYQNILNPVGVSHPVAVVDVPVPCRVEDLGVFGYRSIDDVD